MSFFEIPEIVDDGDEDDDDERNNPTAPFLGAVLPYRKVIAKTDEVAIVLSQIVAFKDGFEMKVLRFTRGAALKKIERSFGTPHGFLPHGAEMPDDFLRIGVAFSDGRKATNLEMPWNRDKTARRATCGIDNGGGGGSPAHSSYNIWVWPLPSDGELQLIVEWPAFDVPQTGITLDGSEIARLGSAVLPVWEGDEDKFSHVPFDYWDTNEEDDDNE